MRLISASVGLGGRNKPSDVALVQQLLNGFTSPYKLTIDGLVGRQTIAAIGEFQKAVVKLPRPDFLISPYGKTQKRLGKLAPERLKKLSTTLSPIRCDRFILLYCKEYKPLLSANSKGLTQLLGFVSNDKDVRDVRWAAYMLATAMHETARTWLPIEEYGKGKAMKYGRELEISDKAGKKYKNAYFGRGYVQLTWDFNYKSVGESIGLGDQLYFHPERALDPVIAYKIMSHGMRNGTFTGKRLSDYISDTSADYYNARRIINGLDKAELIRGYAKSLEQLLRLSQSEVNPLPVIIDWIPPRRTRMA